MTTMNRNYFCSVVLFITLAFAAAPAFIFAANVEAKKIEGTVQLISVSNDQEFTIAGKTYPMAQLAKRLKSAGARADSEIRVQIPKETPVPMLKKLSAALTMSGYSKFVFVKPRYSESIPGK